MGEIQKPEEPTLVYLILINSLKFLFLIFTPIFILIILLIVPFKYETISKVTTTTTNNLVVSAPSILDKPLPTGLENIVNTESEADTPTVPRPDILTKEQEEDLLKISSFSALPDIRFMESSLRIFKNGLAHEENLHNSVTKYETNLRGNKIRRRRNAKPPHAPKPPRKPKEVVTYDSDSRYKVGAYHIDLKLSVFDTNYFQFYDPYNPDGVIPDDRKK